MLGVGSSTGSRCMHVFCQEEGQEPRRIPFRQDSPDRCGSPLKRQLSPGPLKELLISPTLESTVIRYENRTISRLNLQLFFLVLFFARAALSPGKKNSVAEDESGKACPYCCGKGYVSVPADLSPDDPRQQLSRTTWVRKHCPLCDRRGTISGDDSNIGKRAISIQENTNSLTIFRQTADASAVFQPENRLQALHWKEQGCGPTFAKGNRMRQILGGEAMREVEMLVSELRAISHWDAKYRRHRRPELYERVALVSRKKRRSEIIRRLLRILTLDPPWETS
jgi:hypothetical protein